MHRSRQNVWETTQRRDEHLSAVRCSQGSTFALLERDRSGPHKLGACYALPDVDDLQYVYYGSELPAASEFDAVCKLCARQNVANPDDLTDHSVASSSSCEAEQELQTPHRYRVRTRAALECLRKNTQSLHSNADSDSFSVCVGGCFFARRSLKVRRYSRPSKRIAADMIFSVKVTVTSRLKFSSHSCLVLLAVSFRCLAYLRSSTCGSSVSPVY